MATLYKVENSGKIKDSKTVYRVTNVHPMKDVDGKAVQIPEIQEYTQEELLEQKTSYETQKQNMENAINKIDNVLKEIEKIK